MARFYEDVDENGMPLEDLPETRPTLGDDLDPSGTALDPPVDLDPYVSSRDEALRLLTAFRQKRPSVLARIAAAGGIQQPGGVIGRKGRSARLILRGLLSGLNTSGRMQAQGYARNMANLAADLKGAQGSLDDAESRNKEQSRLQKDINAQLRQERAQDVSEKRFESSLEREARLAAEAGKREERYARNEARADRRLGMSERRLNARGSGRGGSDPGTYGAKRAQINSLSSSEKTRIANAIRIKGAELGWDDATIQQGVQRKLAETEAKRTKMLRDLDIEFGVDIPQAPKGYGEGGATGKGKAVTAGDVKARL